MINNCTGVQPSYPSGVPARVPHQQSLGPTESRQSRNAKPVYNQFLVLTEKKVKIALESSLEFLYCDFVYPNQGGL